ncbi:MAG TPA: hypothetical protein VEK83_10500 [Gemmatimonadales bacterium]|nr:hypothetical protein [Gemmatimonadales bacterium]
MDEAREIGTDRQLHDQMDMIADDADFDDAALVAVRNLWEDTTKKLGNLRVDQRKTP